MKDRFEAFQAIIDANHDQVFALDRDGRYLAFNRAHAAEMQAVYGVEIAVGERQTDYAIAAVDREAALRDHERALAGESFVVSALLGEEGRQSFYEIEHAPQVDAEGEIVGIVVYARDVTEVKRAKIKGRRRGSRPSSPPPTTPSSRRTRTGRSRPGVPPRKRSAATPRRRRSDATRHS